MIFTEKIRENIASEVWNNIQLTCIVFKCRRELMEERNIKEVQEFRHKSLNKEIINAKHSSS